MELVIAAIGKGRSSPEESLYQHYVSRCGWNITLKEHTSPRKLTGSALQQAESDWLLRVTEPCDIRAALDEGGSAWSSQQLADALMRYRDEGYRRIGFCIGGADGHSSALRQQSDVLLSLGKMTWPHLLARAMLAEQLYRAWTLHVGHPYHRA